ncbi:MAG: hypothetical protein LBT55_04755 [Clostridiaceae bacterium]|jgi:hypothetical protein|nr:hypothetical protein [Clostridiaceae bacterium]
MDSNFHYYAIKLLACKAGFTEAQAQKIAEYSQFIDDYDRTGRIHTDTPPPAGISYVKEDDLYAVESVTTGFSPVTNAADLLTEDFQRKVVVPFHFILPNKLTEDNRNFVAIPARLNDGQVITRLMEATYREFSAGNRLSDKILIAIGCMAHAFSDTYAHEGFSGFRTEANDFEIEQYVQYDGAGYKDFTEPERKIGPVAYSTLPAIGHTTIGHTADYTNGMFSLKHKSKPDVYLRRVRNNYEYFMKPLAELFRYFQLFTQIAGNFDDIIAKFKQGFLANEKNAAAVWSATDGGIVFAYDKRKIYDRLYSQKGVRSVGSSLGGKYRITVYNLTSEFYIFNECAAKIRREAVGV